MIPFSIKGGVGTHLSIGETEGELPIATEGSLMEAGRMPAEISWEKSGNGRASFDP